MAAILVAPLAGAWIEMMISLPARTSLSSLPSRERGLKWQQKDGKCDRMVSLPSRERGLKFICSLSFISCGLYVAPLAGAWIEISDCEPDVFCVSSRSPRGSVD